MKSMPNYEVKYSKPLTRYHHEKFSRSRNKLLDCLPFIFIYVKHFDGQYNAEIIALYNRNVLE